VKSLAQRSSFLLATSIFCVLFLVHPTFAQSKAIEGQARGMQKKAMQEDYLATDFDKAQEKLSSAIAKCGLDKCSATLRAELRRDLGVVQIGGQLDKDKGISNWIEAAKLEPGMQLDPDVKTKELEKLWEEAKKQASGGGAGSSKSQKADVPAGDFSHVPSAEQLTRTALPVYAEYGGSEEVVRVIVKYKGFGMPDWKSLELKKHEKGYGGILPCLDVQQGDLVYYLQGFNAQSDPVATSGDRNNPYRVKIVAKLNGDAPHLPGVSAPAQCADPGAATDCPPNFPGCKKAVPVAEAADTTGEDASKKRDGDDCEQGGECRSDQCTAGKCVESTKTFRRFWIGASVGYDLMLLRSAPNVCKLDPNTTEPLNSAGYYCTADGADYPLRTGDGGQNSSIVDNKLDTISGGIAPGNLRVNLAVDVAITANILLGARLGYVFNTYSGKAAKDEGKAFPPLHLEARAAFVFGKDALAHSGVRFFALLGGGVAAHDAKIDVNLFEGTTKKTVQAWAIGGPGFVAVGAGARITSARERWALSIAPKFDFAFGSNGIVPVFSPELAVQVGF
jgi:hypothetical protein